MKNKTRLLLVLASGLLLASTALSITSAVQCKTDYSELEDLNSQYEQQLKDKVAGFMDEKELFQKAFCAELSEIADIADNDKKSCWL